MPTYDKTKLYRIDNYFVVVDTYFFLLIVETFSCLFLSDCHIINLFPFKLCKVYSLSRFGEFVSDCSWLMSKKQKLDQDDEIQFYNNTGKVLANYDSLDATKFNKVDQINCDMP